MSATATERTTNAPYDPWNEAETAQPRNRRYFGHCTARSQPVVLQKGSPAISFNPNLHRTEDRRTQVIISIQPLPGSRFMDPIERNMLVESNEWAKTVLPSIHDIGIKPRDLDGLYVQVEMIPTRDYIKRDGTPGQATVPKIIAIYPSEQLCRDAQEALFGHQGAVADTAQPTTAPTPATNAAMSSDTQRALLDALWTASGKNDAQMAKLLSVTPALKHLTLESPEVVDVMVTF